MASVGNQCYDMCEQSFLTLLLHMLKCQVKTRTCFGGEDFLTQTQHFEVRAMLAIIVAIIQVASTARGLHMSVHHLMAQIKYLAK